MAEDRLYKFRVFCATDGRYEHVWSGSPPTRCPVDSAHAVDEETVAVVDSISKADNFVSERDAATRGFYISEGKDFQVPAQATARFAWSYPYATAVHRAFVDATADNVGDSIQVLIAPDTPVGLLAAPAAAGDTALRVSTTANIVPGFQVALVAGGAASEGIFVDAAADGTVSLRQPLGVAMPAGAEVRMSVVIIHNFRIVNAGVYDIGSGIIAAKAIPAGCSTELRYANADGRAKSLHIKMEYTY